MVTAQGYRDETKALIRMLRDEGLEPVTVDQDPERVPVKGLTGSEITDECMAVGYCYLYVQDTDSGERVSLMLVYGNSPGELVADYSISKNVTVARTVDRVTERHSNVWS